MPINNLRLMAVGFKLSGQPSFLTVAVKEMERREEGLIVEDDPDERAEARMQVIKENKLLHE